MAEEAPLRSDPGTDTGRHEGRALLPGAGGVVAAAGPAAAGLASAPASAASAAAQVASPLKPAAVASVSGKPKLVAVEAEASADIERQKVIHIVRRLREEALQSPALKRRPWLVLSVLAGVVLPTFVASLFYLFVAADRYVSEARFAVRSNEPQAADALGMMTGLPSSAIMSDSYIVADYIESRDMVAELERRLPLRAIYSDRRADWFNRLGADVTLEKLVKYWQRRVDVYYDSTKNTIAVEVQAFAPGEAERIAREIVDIVRLLVNELSAQARRDAVQFAASEVVRAELRLRGARADMLAFRMANNELDPTESASASLTIAAELEGERSRLASQLASLSGYLSAAAPSMQMLKSRIAALDGEIARIQGQISRPQAGDTLAAIGALAGDAGLRGAEAAAMAEGLTEAGAAARNAATPPAVTSGAMASVVGEYQELLVSQEFAEKAYLAAMGSLERARAEAARTQSYLATYAEPGLAEQAAYPVRWLAILIVFVLAATLWATGAFTVLTVKDHMP